AEQTVKQMIHNGCHVKGSTVLMMGLTFKENCADLRNSRVIDVIRELSSYGVDVRVLDPVVSARAARDEYGIELAEIERLDNLDAIVAAVAHDEVRAIDLAALGQRTAHPGTPFIDVKAVFDPDVLVEHGFRV